MNTQTLKLIAISSLTMSVLISAAPAMSQSRVNVQVQPRTISLSGIGQVNSAPDMATIRISVIREAKTARQAVSQNNDAMQSVIDIVNSFGIKKRDIQTSGFSLNPRYIYPNNSKSSIQRPPQIVAYSVSNNLAVSVRNLGQLGTILDSVVSAGSNNIGGIVFSIQNPKPLRDQARRKAMQDAIAKAKLYANEAGFSLGPIKSITESGSLNRPRPVHRLAAARASYKQAPVPIAQGQQAIRMQVNVVWEIK